MNDDIKEIKSDVKEIKTTVNKLSEQAAVHNHVLSEHHKRSLMLEEALKPIQVHVSLMQKILYGAGAIAVAIISQWAIRLLLK